MADVDAAFVQQIFHISKLKWDPDIHHHRQADHLRARLEVLEYVGFGHSVKLNHLPARLHKVFL